jgi:hypothetical protein
LLEYNSPLIAENHVSAVTREPTTSGSFLSDFPDSNIPTLLADSFCFSSTAAFGIPPFPYVPGPGTSLYKNEPNQITDKTITGNLQVMLKKK